jgi:hypothetical protein
MARKSASKATLTKAFVRILKKHHLPFEILEEDADTSTIVFEVEASVSSLTMEATVFGRELIVLLLPANIEIAEDRLPDLVTWVLDANAKHAPSTFVLDLEERTLAIRHSIDCRAIPTAVLDDVLPLAWMLLADIWRDYAPEVLRVVAGQSVSDRAEQLEGESLPDEGDIDEAVEHAADSLAIALMQATTDRFDQEVADALEGALHKLAHEYIERIAEASPASVDDIDIRIKGTDESSVLAVAVQGVRPLRFRFSPRKVRERLNADELGLVLYHNASPASVQRLLRSGFVNERIVTRDYQADVTGVPVNEGEEQITSAVLVTSAPLGPDDRGPRTAVVRIEWDGDAPGLAKFERIHSVYDGNEACVLEDGVRKWHIPAEILNDAVSAQLAVVTPID